jgi:type II restriction/modification system DNA methylase subunit YeeA
MNHTPLKKFAAKARVDLIEQVGARLQYVLNSDSVELREKAAQVKQLREALKQESETALVERVAYLWFNRLAALRFMDAEGRHPFGCRVVTATPGNTQPELLQQARSGSVPDGLKLDVQRLNDLLDGRVPSSNAQAEVYRMLVVSVCNFYHQLMPFVFEKIADYSELLLPEELLSEASVAEGFRSAIADEDCVDVEVLGWLYQYYIAEKKDAVMARKKAVPKEDIPAVTQLFTPHWIVRYMVENSLGRLWMHSRPSSRLVEKMDYYIPDAEDNETDPDQLTVSSPEEIRLIDPACGSGHILTYAFDLLYAIYEEEGYEPSSIPGHILTKNLHGVEIDERAAELAYFALMMKAQQHYGRFLRRQLRAEPRERIVPEICCLEEIHFEEGELKTYMDALDLGELFTAPVLTLMHQFEEAKNFGSLIQPAVNDVAFLRDAIEEKDLGGELFLRETHRKVTTVLRQAGFLGQRYHCAVANPPFFGYRLMNAGLSSWMRVHYNESRYDLFSAFIERLLQVVHSNGLVSMITMQSWMFLSSYQQFRDSLISHNSITSMIHLGARAFDSIGGEVVSTTAFTIKCRPSDLFQGTFIRAVEGGSEAEKRGLVIDCLSGRSDVNCFYASNSDFHSVPGTPIGYWLTEAVRQCFSNSINLREISTPRQGNTTTDNNRFVRLWHEVCNSSVGVGHPNAKSFDEAGLKWAPYNKGGGSRAWFGLNDTVVNWENDGAEIKAIPHSVIANEVSYFTPGITWSTISSGAFGFRFFGHGFIFDNKGASIFIDGEQQLMILGVLNAVVFRKLLGEINPTVSLQPGDVGKFPMLELPEEQKAKVIAIVSSAVSISRADWNNFETSWDFLKLPLLREELNTEAVSETWNNWESYCKDNIERMQELETENNRLWIEAYGLQNELTPEVPEEEITLARANPRDDMAAFISYAVGCMFGRYSLDKPGLILANAGETIEEYLKRLNNEDGAVSFMPDEDNIIPVLDGEWFEDDIVARFREFLKVTFGEDTLRENINFIEESLGKELRKYFVADFYKDHLKTYKKRPIYWLFQSPKKSFQALIYLHRYDRDTVNLLLNDYLREFQNKLQNRRKHLEEVEASESSSAKDKTAAKKEMMKIDKTLPELADWERDVILPLAQQRLEIDLDDGVKQNYPKFGKALAKVPGMS